MNATNSWAVQFRQWAVLLLFCFVTCTALRLLVKSLELSLTVQMGWMAILIGALGGWWAIRRWRNSQPLRCAGALGIFGGIGGAGLVTLLLHLMIRVLSP